MAIDVSPATQANRDESPTNPKFADASISDGDLMAVVILADDGNNFPLTIGSENSNQANTKGFRIKHDTDGSNLLTLSSFGTDDYFVLLYSDDPAKHHFAKITNLIVEDNGNGTTTGDAFEFEPKMGSEIPKGTKYRVITGTNINSNSSKRKIIALSVGLKQESTYNLKNNIVCARPHFYFYNDIPLAGYSTNFAATSHGKLTNKNELNHNFKYYASMNSRTGAGTILMGKSNTTGVVFRTVQDFGKRVIDYSKFSLKTELTDVLRNLDEDGFGSTSSNSTLTDEGNTVTTDYTDYRLAYPNCRRDDANHGTIKNNRGEMRYLHYDTSPQSANLLTGVSQHETEDSIEQGSFSETRIIDNARIIRKKINEHDAYETKQLVHIGNLNDFVDLKATYSSTSSSNVFAFDTEYDLSTVLEVGDEIKLGTTIMLVASFGSFTNNTTTQTITVRAEKRQAGKGSFTSVSFTPTAGDTLQRRAMDFTNRRIFTTMDLSGDFENLEVVFTSGNMQNLFAGVIAKDINKSTIDFHRYLENDRLVSYYSSNGFKFVKGEYRVFSVRFAGEVEEINQIKEEGQTFLDIKGRGALNKLLSPIVNKDTVFSEDIIYSSFSPYNKLTTTYSGNGSSAPNEVEVFDNTIQFGVSSASFTSMPVVGDLLFSVNGYIGRVKTVSTYSGSLVQVSITRAITRVAAGETIYKQSEKNYMFTKALGSSHIVSSSPTSLSGSSEKGLIFTAGNMNLGLGFNAAEGDSLVNTSSFGSFNLGTGVYTTTDKRAVGYQIHEPSSIANDNPFQCKLKDEISTNGESGFDTVDTLIDFEVVSTTKKDNITEIELAPYIPLTLGRKIKYEGIDAERMETTYTQAAVVTDNESARTVTFVTASLSASVNIGDPLYCETFANSATETKGFIGYVLDIFQTDRVANFVSAGNPATNTSTIKVQLDRTNTSAENVLDFDIGSVIFFSTRKRHHINTLNSAHLWGGKMITIPHHTFLADDSSRTVPFNMHLGTSDMNKEFGMSIYKSFNSDTKRLGDETFTFDVPPTVTAGFFSVRKTPFVSNFTSYQFKPNVNSGLNNVIEEGKTDSNRKMPYDMRGMNSAYGSNITYQRRMKRDNAMVSAVPTGIRGLSPIYSMAFEYKDHSFPRLFFYMTCDILPYSDNRPSSIFSTLKTINNYKLFLLENAKKTDGTDLVLQDSNFQTLSFTTEVTLNNLKRFGLMRLTECVYDENFNLFNPEKSTDEIYSKNETAIANQFHTRIALTGNSITAINSPTANTITFQNSLTLSRGDEIFTSDGKFICRLHLSDGPEISGGTSDTGTVFKTVTGVLHSPDFSTTHSNPVRVITDFTSFIKGRHKTDSLIGTTVGSETKYHPLKGAIIPKSSNYDYGEFSGDWAYEFQGNSAISMPDDAEVVLPSIYRQKLFNNANFVAATHNSALTIPTQEMIDTTKNNVFGGTIGVILDRYDIEDSFHKLEAGNCTGVLGTNTGGREIDGTEIGTQEIINVCSLKHFKEFLRVTDLDASPTVNDYGTADFRSPADGAFIGFKLRLFYDTSSGNIGGGVLHRSTGSQIYKTVITPHHPDKTAWLKYVDLTGCYLVEESGTASVSSVDSIIGTKVQPIYVYAQEVTNGSDDVELYTEVALTNGKAYRIMQPNPVCFYEESPDNIQLFVPRPEYTKKANSNEMYGKQKSHYFFNEGGKEHETTNEAVLSMYAMIDVHNQTVSTNIITTLSSEVLPTGEHELFYSDGINSFKTNTSSKIAGENLHTLVIKDKKKLNGVVSVSETFVVDSLEELKISPNRACIGSTVTIANETESLINEIFEEEGIEFTNSTITYPLFVAPEFRGVSAFTAINFLLKKKDLRLLEANGVFSVVPHSDSNLVTNILIDDDKLIEFESTRTTFDFYNEVIVYGAAHKGTKRNLNSIKKIGRKTLEEVDSSLITQQDVDEQASKLLGIHGNLNVKHRIKVIPTGMEQVKAGDIIQFESKQENIGLSNFLVLNVNHELFGFVTLEIGKYSKRLEDVFSELLLKTQNNANKNRSQDYISKTPSLDFLEKIKIKPISLTIRKRTSSGTTLGFTTTLNTNTTPLGIGGSSTATLLKEEDLI